MTQRNQTYSVLTRELHPLWKVAPWALLLEVGMLCLVLFLQGEISRDAVKANALTYEDGLALANKRLKEPLPKSAREEVEAMVEIAWRESRFNRKMQNPTSTSSGLYGFLDSTYRNYGGKTNDPLEQTRMALRYITDRYGSPRKALSHHKRKNWY